jgi:hypothetical protein
MCFSEQASIVSFVVGIVGSALCVSLGTITDKIVGCFLAFVSCMQGIEYLLWKHQVCDNYNRILSLASMLFVHAQPIVLGIIVMCFAKPRFYPWIILLLIFYACIILQYSIPYIQDKTNQCILKNETHHLHWKWNGMKGSTFAYRVYILTFCAMFLLGIPRLENGILFSAITVASVLSSRLLYPSSILGSLWCYYVAYFPGIYFIVRHLM